MADTKQNNKKKSNRIKRNLFFNILYQLLVVLTPLISAPYIARVLGADNVGQFAFAYTIICYFVIFAYLGFQQSAQRAIAEVQDDIEEQSRTFWQIVLIRLIPVSIAVATLLILYAVNAFGSYSPLVLIFAIIVGASAFDINFYFRGKENFFIVMVINLVIRFVYLFLIFTLVKTSNDVGTYALLYSLMVFACYLSMWALLPAHLKKVKLNGLNFKKHFKASGALFLPVAAVSIYALLDKTLIGSLITGKQYVLDSSGSFAKIALISEVENGYYFQAERVIKALLSIILAMGGVMSIRNSVEYSKKRKGAIKKNIYHSFQFVFVLAVPMALGTVLIANSFAPLYFGKNYDRFTSFSCDGVANLLMIYTPILLLSGLNNILGSQYLLPTKQDKKYAISVGVGFVVNLGLNCLLIPFMGAAGAVIGTLVSEFAILLVQYIYVHKDFSFKIIFVMVWKYLVAGIAMCVIGLCFKYFVLSLVDKGNLFDMVILIPSGVLLYYLILLLLRDHYVFRVTKTTLKYVGRFLKGTANNAARKMVQAMSFVLTTKQNQDIGVHEVPGAIPTEDNKSEPKK